MLKSTLLGDTFLLNVFATVMFTRNDFFSVSVTHVICLQKKEFKIKKMGTILRFILCNIIE